MITGAASMVDKELTISLPLKNASTLSYGANASMTAENPSLGLVVSQLFAYYTPLSSNIARNKNGMERRVLSESLTTFPTSIWDLTEKV